MKTEHRTANIEVRTGDGHRPTIFGHIPYNSRSVLLGGAFTEVILPGAFRETAKKGGQMALWSHDAGKPIGSTDNGSLVLDERATGLDVTIYPNTKTSWGKDVHEAAKSGLIRGFSFGFVVEKDRWSDDGNIRELEKVKLFEVSPVVNPAYQQSTISARGLKGSQMSIRELYEERAKVDYEFSQLREKDFDSLNTEERDRYEKLELKRDELTTKIDHTRQDEMCGIFGPTNGPLSGYPDLSMSNRRDGYTGGNISGPGVIDLRAVFPDINSRGAVPYQCKRSGEAELRLWETALKGGIGALTAEQRGLFQDDVLQGGFLVAPQIFVTDLIADVRDATYALQECKVIPAVNADSLGVASLDSEPDDGDWTSELNTGSEDDAMKTGKRELHPHPLAKRIKVSKKLLRSAPRVDSIVRDALKYKLAVPIEKAWISTAGDGVNQPLSVFVDSEHGITSARDVSEGNTATAIKADNLINCKYALKAQYHKNAKWVFHRDVVKAIRKLKTGEGDFLWRAGLSSDAPDTILDVPFIVSEYAPSTFSASQYVGIIGDFKVGYWFAIALNMTIQVLVELYSETNQNGYIARAEIDGQPMIEEAFVRVQLAS